MVKKLKRKIEKIFCKPINKKIVFLHIPKCGGTSIVHSVRKCYYPLDTLGKEFVRLDEAASFNVGRILSEINKKEFHDGILVNDYYILKVREYLLLFYLSKKHLFINGHFPFSIIAHQYFHREYVFITMLRDPVKRWISEYIYNRYKTHEHRKINMEIEDYLKTKYGKAQGHQLVKFIGGASIEEDYTSKKAIERAKYNLDKIDIIGFIEHQEYFVKHFYKCFGKKLNIGHLNESSKPTDIKEKIFSKEILEQINNLCAPDIEVYNYAISKFLK